MFNGGPGGYYGQMLLQLTPTGATELDWPSVQEVEELVPMDRRVVLSGNSDVPSYLPPAITAMTCRRKGAGYRCRYATTIADWIGRDPPRGRFVDDYRRRPDGRWVLLTP